MAKERNVENDIVEWLRSIGDYVSKNPGSFLTGRGLSDRSVCHRGHYIALEIKHPNLRLASQHGCYPFLSDDRFATGPQVMHLQMVRDAGGIAFVVNRLETVKALIRKIDEDDAAAKKRSQLP